MTALQRAVEAGDIAGGMNAIPWDKLSELETELSPVLKKVLDDSGKAAAAFLPKDMKVSFDTANPESFVWIKKECGDLVTLNIRPGSQAAIKETIRRAFKEGIPPMSAARIIRGHVGILPRHAAAVNKFYERMVDEVGIAKATKAAEKYAKKLLNYRAKNIARTETIRASSQGQQTLWDQAMKDGLISPAEWERVWITDAVEPTCPICVRLNRKTAEMKGPFPGGYMMPPDPHPSCRCSVGLQRKKTASKTAGEESPLAATTSDFGNEVKGAIAKGMDTYSDAIRVGSLINAEWEKRLIPKNDEIRKQLAESDRIGIDKDSRRTKLMEIEKEWKSLRRAAKYDAANKLAADNEHLWGEYKTVVKEYNAVRKTLRELRTPELRAIISEIREVGGVKLSVSRLSDYNIRDQIQEVMDTTYIPKDWLEATRKQIQLDLKETKGRGGFDMRSKIIVQDKDQAAMMHEMSHVFEKTNPKIYEMEKAFYKYRTEGETLKWMGPGYEAQEVARKDKFIELYMGKDYREYPYWEIFSMGNEFIYDQAERLAADPEYRDFILGLLGGL